nr:hypothetical protein [Candidatus Saccharibacteria bacterium]
MSFPKIRSSSVLAVGIALSPVASTPTEAVGADSSCEQVVDTTRMATGMSARLSRAIFDIQEDGVIVAVRLREGEPDTASESAIRHFNEGLVYRCSLGEKALVVTVDFGPRKYDIYRGAGINRSLIPNSKVDSALPSFRDNLRDTASPPQDDVAALIQSLDPTPHNQGTTTADKQNSNPNPSFNVSEIPWEGILKGVSTAGLLGGIIFAFRRRKSAVII